MTATQELTLLEAAYTTALSGGGYSDISMNGRMVRVDLVWLTKRIDQLRAQVAQEASGGTWAAAKFRNE